MRKIISCILIMVVLVQAFFLSSCLADSFSIRNGITLGMDVDEVERIEEKNGLTGGINNRDEYPDWPTAGLKYVDRNLLGLDHVMLKYIYEKETNEVYEISYSIYDKDSVIKVNDYESLRELLEEKYGPATFDYTDGKTTPFAHYELTDNIDTYLDHVDKNKKYPGTYNDDFRWNEWLVEFDEYYVDICFLYYFSEDQWKIARTKFELYYTMISKEDVAARINQINESNEKLKDSI